MVVNNPNNWHWVDKNCIYWAKEYFADKLPGTGGLVKVKEVRSVEGDVEVCQRKGKVISLFDLKLVLAVEKNGKQIGTVTVPEVAYDTEPDEYQFLISLDEEDDEAKKDIRKSLEPELRKTLAKFGTDLITTHGNDIQLPESQVSSNFTKENQKSSVVAATKTKTAKNDEAAAEKQTTRGPNTASLHLESTFTTTSDQLFECFIDPNRVGAWTRAPPVVDAKIGGKYSLFHGNIEGEFTKLDRPDKIEMTWRLRDWKSGHFAKLVIRFIQGDSETKADIMFNGIPIGEEEKVEGNFQEYYIRAIKLTFGYGIVL